MKIHARRLNGSRLLLKVNILEHRLPLALLPRPISDLIRCRALVSFLIHQPGVSRQMKNASLCKYDCLPPTQTLLTPDVISAGHPSESAAGVI